MKNEIESLIEEKVSKMLNMKKPTAEPKKKTFTHSGITCDGCHKGIHNMARYKSLIRDDYDLCEECERKGLHPGPMVRYSEPSTHNNWHLDQKFRQIRHVFASETNNSNENCHEGFRFPRYPGCPFRGGRGPRHCRRSQQNHSNEQSHTDSHIPSFLQDMMKNTSGPLSGLFKLIPDVLQNLTKPTATTQASPRPTTTANTTETMGEDKPVDNAKQLALDAHEVLSHVSPCILEAIIRENHFTSVEEVLNYLL